uniref:Chitin-binding type-2 domain-containing protein n=2 Tax=Rhodnius prolixus TaxID=13249 RepID=T1HX71_RHOPR
IMRWHETWIVTVFVLYIFAGAANALRGSELVLAAKAKAAEEKNHPTTEEVTVVVNEDGTNSTVVKAKPLLTGIPQKDYIYDPNLPRELKGHNLTNYPFYNAVPNDIEFECDGLHDGFYASVPHQCQLYHHCLFGTRYDFLCANYTAFDQKTFICHFVSEVDCANSPKYYKRNEALYKQASSPAPPKTTTTKATTTTTTTTTSAPTRKSGGGRRRRPPYRRRRPVYEYYYDDEEYDDEYYDEEEEELPPPRKHAGRRHHHRPQGGRKEDHTTTTTTSTTSPTPLPADAPLTRAPLSVYAPRALPKIKRPVPINEKSKYDYTTKPGSNVVKPTTDPRTVQDEDEEEEEEDDDYYEDDYEDLPPPQPPPPPKKKESAKNGRRRVHQQERKRPVRYDDDYDEEEERPRLRKGNRKGSAEDDYRPRSRGSNNKGRKGHRDEDEPIPSERPGFISGRGSSRKRYQEERLKKPERWRSQEYEYYDEEEDESSRYEDDRRRPMRPKSEKMRARSVKKTTTTTTSTTTSKTTSGQPSFEEEDEYEEYDDFTPVSEEIKTKYRNSGITTIEPHRFSTSSYKNTKQGLQTTTEAITRQKTQPVTYRRPISDFRRPSTKPSETFLSSVGTPAGFKKQEAEVKLKKEPVLLSRRPFTSPEDTVFRRPIKVEGTSNREIKKAESLDLSAEVQRSNLKQNKEVKDTTAFEPEGNVRFSPESPKVAKPMNQESYYSGDTSVQLDVRPESEDTNPRRVVKPEFSFPATGVDRRPEEGYRKFPRPAVYTPSAPENVPAAQVYRRPFIPSPADNSRRPVDEIIAIRRPSKQDNFSPFTASVENGFRRPYIASISGEGDFSVPEDQNKRPPKQESVNSDGSRRPDGMPMTVAGYRRGTRPTDKEKKKILEELAYSGRRTKENPTTPETVTERGPNYRNPFSVPPPVREESEYFKPPKSVEFTAPGPSGEGSTQRPPPVYDIDEEYDVTLNDALQPSTLNPTLHYARVKTRGYQSAVTHPSYHSLLIPSASQTFYSKTPAHNNDDYDTVVLPAARFTQARYKQRRPAEWYW